jgi:hypothetical protein
VESVDDTHFEAFDRLLLTKSSLSSDSLLPLASVLRSIKVDRMVREALEVETHATDGIAGDEHHALIWLRRELVHQITTCVRG